MVLPHTYIQVHIISTLSLNEELCSLPCNYSQVQSQIEVSEWKALGSPRLPGLFLALRDQQLLDALHFSLNSCCSLQDLCN